MWMMSAAGTRFDDFQEGQIRDGLPFPNSGTDAFELTFFGTQTDPTFGRTTNGRPSSHNKKVLAQASERTACEPR